MLSAIAFLIMVGFGVVLPVLPVYAREFGASNFMVAAVVSSFALMRLVTSPATGWLTKVLRGRPMLTLGILIVAASSAAMGFAHSFAELLVFRALGGIGSAMFTVSALALLLASVEPGLRGRASGLYSGGFMVGSLAGPAIGGLLAAISLRAPFFFYAGSLVAAAAVGWFLLPRLDAAKAAAEARQVMSLRQAVRDVRYRAAALTNFAQGWQSMGVRSSLIPVFVVETLHEGPQWTGAAFAAASAVQMATLGPAGRLVDTRGRRLPIVLGCLITGIMSLLLPLSGAAWMVIVVLCVYGLGSSLLSTAPTAAVGDVTGGNGGTAIAYFSMASDVGGIIGPLAAGLLADHLSLNAGFAAGAVLLLLAAAYATRMPSLQERSGASTAD